ncbi:TonB-dependent receptor [Sphingomonas histidinilytica]|uniref:TonB dependent receptor n=1 Tax=Rhizorhabdus histidinilytica TaxID=439228 RepID=A0A1T5FZV5_9SPHN|nr:TonB-dependent receptor [Rhizorhabdus histidinilytica]MBO9378452.1 TonB-dependent receptor [Rhizorhabdus histidinilytica]SKC01716.1 TonB dependent receptor [Rhizorhabdus histidinilytica]
MRPLIGLATLGLAMLPEPAIAQPLAVADAPAGWIGLRNRPFSVGRLIGEPRPHRTDVARVRALGPAPDGERLISFARSSTDAPSPSLLLRDAPRFSRLPGRQTDDYEVGLRGTLADPITIQAGFSYNKFRNLETSLRQNGRLMTASAGKAKTYGVESMARWTANEHVSLFVAAAYREGRLKNRVRDGRKFRLSSDRSASFGAVVLIPAGAGRIAFIPSLAYQSAMSLGRDGGGLGAATLVNAQLGYAFSDGFEVEALAANLLGARHAGPPVRGAAAQIAGEPRVFGIRARLRFGTGL